jgi:phytoene synthase
LASLEERRAVSRTDLRTSYAWCKRVARKQAGNFYPAFCLLPRDQRLAMCALYAFMRVTDDIVDEPGEPEIKRQRLADWREQFGNALNGRLTHPVHHALTDCIRRYSIAVEHFESALDGAAMDLLPIQFETFADLYRYCYCVASTVGLACIRIWGCRDASAEMPAEHAGIALQLTNILRDLGEDRARGRVYIPTEDLGRFCCSPEQFGRVDDPAYRNLMAFEVQRAREYYASSEPLAEFLPPPGRSMFRVVHATYRGILDEIERRNYDVLSSRVGISQWAKMRLVLKSLPTRWGLAR